MLLDGTPLERFRGYVPVQMIWQHPELSVNPARRLKTVLAEGDWPEDGGVMRGRIEKEDVYKRQALYHGHHRDRAGTRLWPGLRTEAHWLRTIYLKAVGQGAAGDL